jgi:hypothetical protein
MRWSGVEQRCKLVAMKRKADERFGLGGALADAVRE